MIINLFLHFNHIHDILLCLFCGFAFSTIQNQFVRETLKMHRSSFEIHVKSPVLHVIRLNLIHYDMNITNRNVRCFQSRLQKTLELQIENKMTKSEVSDLHVQNFFRYTRGYWYSTKNDNYICMHKVFLLTS